MAWRRNEPDKTSDEYEILTEVIGNNNYSTIVDLEEESFEIARYAIETVIYRKKTICYLEVDKRFEKSKNFIYNTLQAFSKGDDKCLQNLRLRHYMRLIVVTKSKIVSEITGGRSDIRRS